MIARSKSLAGIALLASAAFVLTACAATEEAAPAESSTTDAAAGEATMALSGTLVGAGASSQGAAQEAWVAGFQTANEEVTVSYDPIGSGGGRETFQSGASSFAGSDRASKSTKLLKATSARVSLMLASGKSLPTFLPLRLSSTSMALRP